MHMENLLIKTKIQKKYIKKKWADKTLINLMIEFSGPLLLFEMK
jgi:hypothetical protein